MQSQYLIGEVAKEVGVEAYELRYWEEALKLSVKRDCYGHRVYSRKDINQFLTIYDLKKRGYRLKTICEMIEKKAKRNENNQRNSEAHYKQLDEKLRSIAKK